VREDALGAIIARLEAAQNEMHRLGVKKACGEISKVENFVMACECASKALRDVTEYIYEVELDSILVVTLMAMEFLLVFGVQFTSTDAFSEDAIEAYHELCIVSAKFCAAVEAAMN